MKLDNWTLFNLPKEDRQLFRAFASPDAERSILKDIPIGALDQVRPALRRVEQLSGQRCRVIYRGSRPDRYQSSTRWTDAERFAVYFR